MNRDAIVKIDYQHPDPVILGRASAVLKDGGFVVAPTETRYGLLARADSAELLRRLFALKQRPLSMPTAVFVSDLEQAVDYAEVTDIARQLGQVFLPGPLTVVLETNRKIEAPLSAAGKIGFRVSSAPIIGEILKRVGCPLTATSANRSGVEELQTAAEIAELFGQEVALYLDAGRLNQPASTVVDCSIDPPVILRAGAVAPEALFRAVRKVNS